MAPRYREDRARADALQIEGQINILHDSVGETQAKLQRIKGQMADKLQAYQDQTKEETLWAKPASSILRPQLQPTLKMPPGRSMVTPWTARERLPRTRFGGPPGGFVDSETSS